jgi:hypothetical protein
VVNFLHNLWLTDYLIIGGAADLARTPGEISVSTHSPLMADALGLLGDDLYVHLDEAESLATQNAEWSADDGEAARGVIGDLVLVIRGLLIEHERQASGDCRTCTSTWPCPVVTTIHAFLKDPQRQFVALVRRARDAE